MFKKAFREVAGIKLRNIVDSKLQELGIGKVKNISLSNKKISIAVVLNGEHDEIQLIGIHPVLVQKDGNHFVEFQGIESNKPWVEAVLKLAGMRFPIETEHVDQIEKLINLL